ncbi:MAG: hypothetical protein ABI867_12375 [Kofleriaceae bacterium]
MGVVAVVVSCALAAPAAADPRFGVMADVGVPDGANAAVVVRPIRAVRIHAGMSHNYVSKGVRGGVTLAPFGSAVQPILAFDYGHYFDGDANPLARMIMGDSSYQNEALDKVGYDYANLHAGLEFGRKWFTFYLHAGMSRVTGDLHGLSSQSASVTFSQDPKLTMWTPSARLGFVFYLVK